MLKKIKGKIRLGIIIIKNVKNWERIFLNYFNILNDEYLKFKFRNGEEIKLRNIKNKGDTSGIATIYEIFLMNNYCPNGMLISEKDIVIDIGANMGVFSLYASMKAKFGKVYSFEPFKVHYIRLLDNIKLNKVKNIVPFNFAVCKKSGDSILYLNNLSSGMHSTVFENNSNKKVKINCITLKQIFEKNKISKCNFLKIDCEGAEYEIIYNTPKEIFNKIDKIALEFDNIDKDRNCFELKKILEKNNFKVKIIGENNHQGILYAKK